MTFLWVIIWAIAQAPALGGDGNGWLVAFATCAALDLLAARSSS